MCGSAELTSSLRPALSYGCNPISPPQLLLCLLEHLARLTYITSLIAGFLYWSHPHDDQMCVRIKKGMKGMNKIMKHAYSFWTGPCFDAPTWIKIPVLVLAGQYSSLMAPPPHTTTNLIHKILNIPLKNAMLMCREIDL